MAYDPGAIDAALAAAVGDEPALIAELRMAFLESAERAVAHMELADDINGWRTGAARLRGLAASFGAVRLMALAAIAMEGCAGDVAMIAELQRAIARLEGERG